MAFILNIDTAVETASVCLAEDAKPLQFSMHHQQKDHASWLHPAIQKIVTDAHKDLTELEAVAVSIGPGSYTGLRVGLSAAKGLSFALGIPLITIGTLDMMAYSVRDQDADLFCPLIDARRMEVFTAVYDKLMKHVVSPTAMILDGKNFDDLLATQSILFSGNGSIKLQTVLSHDNARYSTTVATAADMAQLSNNKFEEKEFADLAYVEPFYLKEFYNPARE